MITLSMIYMLVWEIQLTISNLKLAFFGATSTVKNSDKKNLLYSGYGVTFCDGGPRHFGKDFARNVVVFGVDDIL